MRGAIKRRSRGVPLILLCGFFALAQPRTLAAQEQFVITLTGTFDRFCPSVPVPPILARIGESVTFDVSITAQQDLTLRTAVLLPGGTFETFEEVGASLSPPFPSGVVQAQSEVTSTFEWTPSVRRPGRHLFRFFATGPDDFTRFTVCEVPVELEGSTTGCLLTGAADPVDEDAEIDFGTILPGANSTRQARLEFFVEADQMIGADEIFICHPDDSPFRDEGIQAVSGDEAIAVLTFSPLQPGQATAKVGFYHVADVTAGDPCDSGQNKCLQTLDLIGVSARAQLDFAFTDLVCEDPTTLTFILRNESTFDIPNLSVAVGSPVRVFPIGDFSPLNFSLGGAESQELPQERRFRLEFPQDPAEQTGKLVTVSHSGAFILLREPVPAPPCIAVEPRMIDFGELNLNSPASTRAINLLNPGVQDLVVTAVVEPDDQGFRLRESTVSVPGRSNTDIEVDFDPGTTGPKSAVVRFESESGGAIPPVSLAGVALAPAVVELSFFSGELSLSPEATFEIASAAVGARTSSPFRIVNTGSGIAENVVVEILSGEFEVSAAGLAFTLLPGASAEYAITFSPTKSGVEEGVMTVSGNFPGYALLLRGEAVLEPVELEASGLDNMVPPRALDPYPSVGLRLSEPAAEPLEGTLRISFEGGELPPDPSVRFLETGDTVSFRFSSGESQAEFRNEPDRELVRYQSGTVAGKIQFLVTSLETAAGSPVAVAGGPEVGSTEVPELAPSIIDGLSCVRTGSGVAVSLKAFSTIRQINGVDIDLSQAPNTELTFSKPAEDFANNLFSSWFSSPESTASGGAFALVLPISVTEIRSLGSISMRLRNEIGWSTTAEISGNSCLR